MKIRDPKTGAIFDNINFALDYFCDCYQDCNDCPLARETDCDVLADEDPEKAIELMGYGVINENEPNLCSILNVRPLEEFEFDCGHYRIANDGWLEVQIDSGDFRGVNELDFHTRDFVSALLLMINHPDQITHATHWTEQDKEDARCILRLYPKADVVEKSDDVLTICNKFYNTFIENPNILPSLGKGKTARLSEVINYGKTQN